MNYRLDIIFASVLIFASLCKLAQLACLPCQRGDPPPGQYVDTDGRQTKCWNNDECYSYREPKQWCHMEMESFTLEKGCHCNRFNGSCIVVRRNGDRVQWSYCTSMSLWECPSANALPAQSKS